MSTSQATSSGRPKGGAAPRTDTDTLVASALAAGAALLEHEPPDVAVDGYEAVDDAFGAMLDVLSASIEDAHREPADVVVRARTVATLTEARFQWRMARTGRRLQSLTAVHDGLHRLRRLESAAAMLDRCTAEVCASCGFERAVLSRVVDSHWVIQDTHYIERPEWAAEFVTLAASRPRPLLNHMLLETEMIRRHGPAMVRDAAADPRTYKPMIEAADVRSYVAAPIMPEGRVIGFLHADHYFSGTPVNEVDRDILWAFAEGFGHAFERTVLLERLRAQREEIRKMVERTDLILRDLAHAEIQLAGSEASETAALTRSAAGMFVPIDSSLYELLTRREVQVLSHMTSGATNPQIAAELIISEGTVKSHVKNILRKLQAANRAEAVSRYLRMTMQQEQ